MSTHEYGPSDPRGNLFSLEEAAEKLHLSPATLRRLRQQGEIPFVKIGHHVFVAESDLIAFIEKRKDGARP